jgi:hypothetical protein
MGEGETHQLVSLWLQARRIASLYPMPRAATVRFDWVSRLEVATLQVPVGPLVCSLAICALPSPESHAHPVLLQPRLLAPEIWILAAANRCSHVAVMSREQLILIAGCCSALCGAPS